ncbi:MAG: DNA polymerase I, partial [Cellvibrionaceae bacterium]|nr:DNA polymerase I [Cellvibrionaceae bacterium]
MANAPLLLVDGSSYLYRAFHALPPLSTSKGQPTGAVRGVISMLKRLIADYPDSQVVVIFDAKGKTFRDDIYPEYKANRPPMPDDLRLQIEPLHQIIRAMGLPLVVIEGVEADDVIGTLAQQADQLGEKCIISTGDKDMAQLVNDNVSLVNTMDNTVMDIPGVEKKFGIPPRYIIDYLALMGDKVDNIPGVPGVGEKTALALIQGLGGIDEIYSNLEKIKDLSFRGAKNMAAKMLENKEQAYLSYRLATIKTDVDIHRQSELLQAQEADNETLLKQFTELEFKSWALEMQQTSPAIEAEQIPTEYSCILEQATFDAWIKQLSACEAFAIDTETTSLNYMQAKIVGVSFAIEPGKAAYVPCGHDYLGAPNQLALDYVLNALKPILENPEIIKIGQNLKYDAEVLLNYGVKLKGKLYDTMLESYTFNAIGNRHDMDTLAATHLGIKTTHFEDVAGKGAKQLSFNQVDIQQAAPYAAEDADITLRLHHKLWPQLEQKAGPKTVFESIEMPLLPVLITIERNGAMIDA